MVKYPEIEDILAELEEAKCEQEELDESGDLEDRLENLQRIEDLESLLFKVRMIETGER